LGRRSTFNLGDFPVIEVEKENSRSRSVSVNRKKKTIENCISDKEKKDGKLSFNRKLN
jgi:hypothetical protein